MNKIIVFIGVLIISFSSFSFAAESCKEREDDIKEQIKWAKKYNNHQQLKGLNIALDKIQKYCK